MLLPAMMGAVGGHPLMLDQTVPGDDDSSAASGWSKCGKETLRTGEGDLLRSA
jgi:hypothetical protein